MKILNFGNIAERSLWIDTWQRCEGKEVYEHPDYLTLYLDKGTEACCAILETEEGIALYPFIKRDLTKEIYYEPEMGSVCDIVTAYGYGGCRVYGKGNLNLLIDKFYLQFTEWAVRSGVVSEFIRFALDSLTREQYPGYIELNNDNIIVDLTLDQDALWSSFKHKVRKNVKKASASGVIVECDLMGDKLDAFLEIYYGTMKRKGADDGYYFDRKYFESIGRNLKGQFVYFHAIYEGIVISSELVLVSDHNIYSFLGGTQEDFFDLRPNDLLKFEIIKWGKMQGKKSFILGGGYTSHDGIFNYKQTFAPEGIIPFYVGKRIFNRRIYDQLVENKRTQHIKEELDWNENNPYFPLYRVD